MALELWSFGHSTHDWASFSELLRFHAIEAVADVRRFPASRRLPHFTGELFEANLKSDGLLYLWLPELGGRRQPAPGPLRTAWRNRSFAGYADHLESEEFSTGLYRLLGLAGGVRTAMLCAEALWWRCHRRLIADVLVALDIPVWHIADRRTEPHRLLPPARLERGRLTYSREWRDASHETTR